eukprot:1158070-Pelagomonas_calceolata.AAC.3
MASPVPGTQSSAIKYTLRDRRQGTRAMDVTCAGHIHGIAIIGAGHILTREWKGMKKQGVA